MSHIGLFRSAQLDEHGQQIIKAIVVGDDMPDESYDAFEKWLSSPDEHLVVLKEGTRVSWLG